MEFKILILILSHGARLGQSEGAMGEMISGLVVLKPSFFKIFIEMTSFGCTKFSEIM